MKIIALFFIIFWVCLENVAAVQQLTFSKPDYEKLVSRADLVYEKPVSRSEEGMPVGNGRMGSLVWTDPYALKFQINRVDIFANNSDSDNFFERHSDYCGGAGFIDIDFFNTIGEVFAVDDFNQRLSCYEGMIFTNGRGVNTRTLAWHEKDVIAVEIYDRRNVPEAITTNLRMLREPVARTGDHLAASEFLILDDFIVLKQEFREDDFYSSSAVVVTISGRSAKARLKNEREVQLVAQPGAGSFTVFIASAASFDPKEDVVALAISQLQPALQAGFENILHTNKTWWSDFWQKSFVRLSSADGEADFVEQNYTYYLYVMASSSRGKYPPKFNGMLWITGGDPRKWGMLYWGANQSCLYNGLFPVNRAELMDPMFKLYTDNYASFATAAKQQWNSKGIFIPETMGFDGIPELPKAISKEMQQLYLLEKPWEERTDTFKRYAYTKLPFHSRWNWKTDAGWVDGVWNIGDKEAGPFGHVNHIFSRGAKIAYQFWMRYEYTLDVSWLREKAYPMLKGVAEFYRNYPHVIKESDGKYHIYLVNDNESVWNGHNTIEEISSMKGIFPVLIRASEILGVDKDMRSVWKEFIDNLSDFPKSAKTLGSDKSVVWVKSLEPVSHGSAFGRPDPNTMPVWFFDLCNLGTDPAILETANATYDLYFPNGINKDTRVNVLSKLPVAGAILGRVDATRYLIPNQVRTQETEILTNRMDLREGFQTTSVQRLGRMADALHNALCQSGPIGPGGEPIIHLFPAWPTEWDAEFKLLCRGNFLVHASSKQGHVEFVEIVSNSGADCVIVNPWPGRTVSVKGSGKLRQLKGKVLRFKTVKGERIVLNKVL